MGTVSLSVMHYIPLTDFTRSHKANAPAKPPARCGYLPGLRTARGVSAFVVRRQALRSRIQLFKTIAVAVNRGQAPAILRREPELVADAAHVRVQRARCHHRVGAPHAFADMSAREQAADIAQEQNRQIEI